MLHETAVALCRIFLLGPIAVLDAAGRIRTPRGKKTKALVALLALAPHGSRSRAWLRDKLWSDREEEQAAASLRQALCELRKALGPIARNVLLADTNTVSLDFDQLWVDVRALEESWADFDVLGLRPNSELLEGLDVGDPEFEEWLAVERQFWARRIETVLKSGGAFVPVRTIDSSSSYVVAAAARELERQVPRRQSIARVGILPPIVAGGVGITVGDRINELVAKCLMETGDIEVADFWSPAAPDGAACTERKAESAESILPKTDLVFQCRLISADNSVQSTVCVHRAADRAVVWVDSLRVELPALRPSDPGPFEPLVRRAVDGILQAVLSDPYRECDADIAGPGFVLSAVHRIFLLSEPDLARAEQTLRAVLKLAPSSQACAWLAFLISFRVGQRFSRNVLPLLEEAQDLAHQAVSLDPQNALSLSLVGHVQSYLFGEYDAATDLFERAIRINPAQPLSWDLYSMLHAYIGRPETGLRCARWGRELGTSSPYRYYFDTSCCITAALSGRHEEAVRLGQIVLQDRPQFNSILRYLVSSYAHLGQRDKAQTALLRLAAIEPDFSLEALRDARYPLLRSEGGANFIEGLVKAGVRRTSN